MKQVSATVLTLTKKPDELTPESQVRILFLPENFSYFFTRQVEKSDSIINRTGAGPSPEAGMKVAPDR
jgi:hypothetical protein